MARSSKWSAQDLAILLEHWPKGGCAAVRRLLPHRSEEQLRRMASKHGCKVSPEAKSRLSGIAASHNGRVKEAPVDAVADAFNGWACR